jgi:FO synthase subunit 1
MLSTGTIVTYSPAFTLVPTRECFNHCQYCHFRTAVGADPWLSLEQAEAQLLALDSDRVCELLILCGEVHPASPRRSDWIERIQALCQLALTHGFLPHTNAGILSQAEFAQLQTVNVSMGLMLEQVTPALMTTVHRHAPSKNPQTRLTQLEWAGQQHIPFTTGLLIGLGETPEDWHETLVTIAQVQARWGHIQEVIIQPFSPSPQFPTELPGVSPEQLLAAVTLARRLLPESIAIQIPPNLIETPDLLRACLDAGARDLGGIGPVDVINPDYPHDQLEQLRSHLADWGYQLQPRLPIYPAYDHWLSPTLQEPVQRWRSRFASDL